MISFNHDNERQVVQKTGYIIKTTIKSVYWAVSELEKECPGLLRSLIDIVIPPVNNRTLYMRKYRAVKRALKEGISND